MIGASDAWSKSHLSRRTSKPAYYIVDCRILRAYCPNIYTVFGPKENLDSNFPQGSHVPKAQKYHINLTSPMRQQT